MAQSPTRRVLSPFLPILRPVRNFLRRFTTGGRSTELERVVNDHINAQNEAMEVLGSSVARLRDEVEELKRHSTVSSTKR